MYEFDLTTIGGYLVAIWELIGGILRFDANAYTAIITHERGGMLALSILFIGGLSLTLGQSVVLFANQVRRRYFATSLMLSAALLVLGVLVWGVTIWAVAAFIFEAERPLRLVLIVVALSYAPLIYGFFVLLPYLGNIWQHVLKLWVLVVLFVAIQSLYQLTWIEALLCCVMGWALREILSWIPGLATAENWLWHLFAGQDRMLATQTAVDNYVAEFRANTPNNDNDQDNPPSGKS